jgi:hypothetical protein
MPDLSSEAEALVVAGRTGLRPSAGDRERVANALRARLGNVALPQGAPQAAGRAPFPLWGKLSALAAAAGVAGAVAVAMLSEPARASHLAAALHAPIAHAPLASASSEPTAALGSAPAALENPAEPRRAVARRGQENLAREVAILSRATSDLNAGRAGRALETLEEHRRAFPNGLLTEERRAGRAQALCALGRRAEAESELKSLARTAPQSPNTVRAREVCARSR